jgi:hypothetical protein
MRFLAVLSFSEPPPRMIIFTTNLKVKPASSSVVISNEPYMVKVRTFSSNDASANETTILDGMMMKHSLEGTIPPSHVAESSKAPDLEAVNVLTDVAAVLLEVAEVDESDTSGTALMKERCQCD